MVSFLLMMVKFTVVFTTRIAKKKWEYYNWMGYIVCIADLCICPCIQVWCYGCLHMLGCFPSAMQGRKELKVKYIRERWVCSCKMLLCVYLLNVYWVSGACEKVEWDPCHQISNRCCMFLLHVDVNKNLLTLQLSNQILIGLIFLCWYSKRVAWVLKASRRWGSALSLWKENPELHCAILMGKLCYCADTLITKFPGIAFEISMLKHLMCIPQGAYFYLESM